MTIEDALRIAIDAHEGQKDLDGKPVILHPLAVGLSGRNEIEQKVGFLHDVVEDSGVADGNTSRMAMQVCLLFVARQTCRYSISLRSWPSPDFRISGLGYPSGTPPRPGFPCFRSWLPLRHATQARISAFPVLATPPARHPGPDFRVSGLGYPSGTPPKPGFPRFRSWLPLRHATQARISAFPVLATPPARHPSPDSRVSGLGTPSGTPPKPGFPHFRSWLPLRHAP
ncbi:MAG: hypothetical protein ACOX5T_10070 [Candidatus Cryptobacteroides sp.]|jgi:hypothetical protein